MLPTSIAAALLAVFFYSLPSHADPIAPGAEHCVVNVRANDVLNMRIKPQESAPVAAAKRHDACGMLVQRSCRQNWCPVEDGHSLGWVHRNYIAAVSPAIYCVTGVAVGDVLNLRAFPSPQSRLIARLARNKCDIAFLPYSVGAWQKIRVGGRQGWVNRRYLSGQ
jgi:SH3-like domain-containing protein